MNTNVRSFFSSQNTNLLYYWISTDANNKLIHKGDVVRYRYQNTDVHISTVYSQRRSCLDTDGNETDTCTYEIIHASGYDELCYEQNDQSLPPQCPFNRKVTTNEINNSLRSNTLRNPTGFGRVKLWN